MSADPFWHGGGRIDGDMILPPSATGHANVCHGESWVYFTPHRSLALSYAAAHGNPWLYVIEPIGIIEQDPGSILPAGDSLRARQARILRRYKPSAMECDRARLGYALGASLALEWEATR